MFFSPSKPHQLLELKLTLHVPPSQDAAELHLQHYGTNGQPTLHEEYADPLAHQNLDRQGERNRLKFTVIGRETPDA